MYAQFNFVIYGLIRKELGILCSLFLFSVVHIIYSANQLGKYNLKSTDRKLYQTNPVISIIPLK